MAQKYCREFQSSEQGAPTLQTTDRQTDGPSMTYSEHEIEFTFAKNDWIETDVDSMHYHIQYTDPINCSLTTRQTTIKGCAVKIHNFPLPEIGAHSNARNSRSAPASHLSNLPPNGHSQSRLLRVSRHYGSIFRHAVNAGEASNTSSQRGRDERQGEVSPLRRSQTAVTIKFIYSTIRRYSDLQNSTRPSPQISEFRTLSMITADLLFSFSSPRSQFDWHDSICSRDKD